MKREFIEDEVLKEKGHEHFETYTAELIEKSKAFNMRAICELAGVNYQVYRNWKSKGYVGLSEEKIIALLDVMKSEKKENKNKNELFESVVEKIKNEQFDFDDQEVCVVCGILAGYIVNHSSLPSEQKTYGAFNDLLSSENFIEAQEALVSIIKKYGGNLEINSELTYTKLLAYVMGYQDYNSKIVTNYFLLGITNYTIIK